MDEQFHMALSTTDMAVTLSPAQTTIRILNDDGILINLITTICIKYFPNNIIFCMIVRYFDAVVKIGFRQQTYTALESAENVFICVDKNGTTDLSINVTINGSKSLAHEIVGTLHFRLMYRYRS